LKNLIVIVVTCLTVITSCKKNTIGDCFFSTGEISTEARTIGSFNSIILKDNVNLILTKASTPSVSVEAGSNLLSGIITEISDDSVLQIRNDNQCNWIRNFESPINVYVNYVDIDTIEYRSIGNISTTNSLKTDTLWLEVHEGAGEINLNLNVDRLYCALHYGTADIILSGNCQVAYAYSASFGFINMTNLESTFVFMNNRSSNDIYVNVNHQLGATIENVGNIYYTGNPSIVTLDGSGPGQLIKLP